MYRIDDIVTGLTPLVGWEQDWDESKQISEDLTVSESGLHYQDAHPLLTLENLRSVMPSGWTDGFDSYLSQLSRRGIVRAVQTFITRKVSGRMSRNLLERKALFGGVGRFTDAVTNRGAFVGFEIAPVKSLGVTVRIDRIGLQMKGAEGVVAVYLFRSGSMEPVRTWQVNITTAAGAFIWLDLGSDPAYLRSETPGEKWYLGYYQADLPKWMDAIRYDRDWSKAPCAQCNKGGQEEWMEMNKYFRVAPFLADVNYEPGSYNASFGPAFAVSSGSKLWLESDIVYTPNTNYGMNFYYSVGCDLTDFIVSQRGIFAQAIQKQVAYDALKSIALNPDVRVNRNQLNAAQLLSDLDGEPGLKRGLAVELDKAYDALNIDTTSIDPVCLKCKGKGVRYGQA